MIRTTRNRECLRLEVQAELDAVKDQAERNKMGQFATPTSLAVEILRYARRVLGEEVGVRFIDPAIGTGAFFSALLDVFPADRLMQAVGFEIDPHYGEPATQLWKDTGLEIRVEDFTHATPTADIDKFSLLICNPPYVRHHHIGGENKLRLKALTRETCGINMNGLAGLYCYFIGLSHQWMADGGLAGWLIPSEFMSVNYGEQVKRYLLDRVTLLHIHRFDPNEVQFEDALVSSSVVWFTNKKPPNGHKVRMTYGGSLLRPRLERLVLAETLRHELKWTRYPMKEGHEQSLTPVLADFFNIKRGLATGNNKYFILPIEEIRERGLPIEAFRPILPSPRYLPDDEVIADKRGNPVLERQLYLLDCKLSEEEIRERHPTLRAYLDEGKALGITDRYLCRSRYPWYAQEHRPPAPFLCTYLGRSDKKDERPFRFILNHSTATAANVYLMLYPKEPLGNAIAQSPDLMHQVWDFLNGICPKEMLNEGRVYGGGLHKLEPKELGRVPAAALAELLPEPTWTNQPFQARMLGDAAIHNGVPKLASSIGL